MKKLAILAATCALLSACASAPQVTEDNGRTVVVRLSDTNSISGGLTIADQTCAKYDRKAQFRAKVTDTELVYDCVE